MEHGDTIVRLKKLSNIFIELMYGDPCTRQVQRRFTGLLVRTGFSSFRMTHRLYLFSIIYGTVVCLMAISKGVYFVKTLTIDVTIWCTLNVINIRCKQLTSCRFHICGLESKNVQKVICVAPKNIHTDQKKTVDNI